MSVHNAVVIVVMGLQYKTRPFAVAKSEAIADHHSTQRRSCITQTTSQSSPQPSPPCSPRAFAPLPQHKDCCDAPVAAGSTSSCLLERGERPPLIPSRHSSCSNICRRDVTCSPRSVVVVAFAPFPERGGRSLSAYGGRLSHMKRAVRRRGRLSESRLSVMVVPSRVTSCHSLS